MVFLSLTLPKSFRLLNCHFLTQDGGVFRSLRVVFMF